MHLKEVKNILSPYNGMNIYRGCTHGCIYCDSRSKCYHIDHLFEDVEAKINAPVLLENKLKSKKRKCMIKTGSMGDPYCHAEEELKITRECLEIIYKYGFGVSIQTKSTKLLRDLDLLKKINERSKVVVQITLTTSDEELNKIVEPNVSSTRERVEMLKILHQNNIPTIVWLSPILPFINDTIENYHKIIDYCIEAHVYGIIYFGAGLTLREGNREYFYHILDEKFKGLKERYIKEFDEQYVIVSKNDKELGELLYRECKNNNIVLNNDELFKYIDYFPTKEIQLTLFE